MKYRDGNLFLDENEVELLSLTFMSEVEASYPASEFIHGLDEVQAGAKTHIQEIAHQQTPERRRSLQIDILEQLISTCEEFKDRGYAAAQATGCSIQLH
jgi:hypothetical protein